MLNIYYRYYSSRLLCFKHWTEIIFCSVKCPQSIILFAKYSLSITLKYKCLDIFALVSWHFQLCPWKCQCLTTVQNAASVYCYIMLVVFKFNNFTYDDLIILLSDEKSHFILFRLSIDMELKFFTIYFSSSRS